MHNVIENRFIRAGLFIVVFSWFIFTVYEFTRSAVNIGKFNFVVFLLDTTGTIGLAFRMAAGLMALLTISFFAAGRGLTEPETLMSLRWIILGEAVYLLALFPSGIIGLIIPNIGIVIEWGIPCIIESTILPFTFFKLFMELKPQHERGGALKWGLTAGTVYILVFWLNNAGNWIYTVMEMGLAYLANYPLNILSFTLTVIGLFALALYTAKFSRELIKRGAVEEVDIQKVGVIATLLGLYFLAVYMMWILFGSVGGWSPWYQWFLGHNMDLWAVCLPIVGVPMTFYRRLS